MSRVAVQVMATLAPHATPQLEHAGGQCSTSMGWSPIEIKPRMPGRSFRTTPPHTLWWVVMVSAAVTPVEVQVWKFIRFMFGVVTVGILVNLASDYLGRHFPPARGLLVQVAAIAVIVWLLVLATRMGLSYFTSGRYAVEALILNSEHELLLYRHPHHKRMLPPGGRVKHTEFPHLALHRRLQERLGLAPHQYRFEDAVHHGLQERYEDLGEIQRVPAPFLVQRELHQQRTFVRLHYDFIYVLRLLDEDINFEESPYAPVQFVNVSTLHNMVIQGRTFPDVLNAYRRVLQITSGMRDDSDSLSK